MKPNDSLGDGPSWNGTNTRTLITAITKNKDIVHDFKKIIDSKLTGKPVHIEELKSVAEPVGTRSTGLDMHEQSAGRISTRSKKPKHQKSTHFGKNITTFAKADLPSDDEEDIEFNISSSKHEDEEEDDDEDEEEFIESEVDDIPFLHDEGRCLI